MNPSFTGQKEVGSYEWTREWTRGKDYFKPFFTIEEELKKKI